MSARPRAPPPRESGRGAAVRVMSGFAAAFRRSVSAAGSGAGSEEGSRSSTSGWRFVTDEGRGASVRACRFGRGLNGERGEAAECGQVFLYQTLDGGRRVNVATVNAVDAEPAAAHVAEEFEQVPPAGARAVDGHALFLRRGEQ